MLRLAQMDKLNLEGIFSCRRLLWLLLDLLSLFYFQVFPSLFTFSFTCPAFHFHILPHPSPASDKIYLSVYCFIYYIYYFVIYQFVIFIIYYIQQLTIFLIYQIFTLLVRIDLDSYCYSFKTSKEGLAQWHKHLLGKHNKYVPPLLWRQASRHPKTGYSGVLTKSIACCIKEETPIEKCLLKPDTETVENTPKGGPIQKINQPDMSSRALRWP